MLWKKVPHLRNKRRENLIDINYTSINQEDSKINIMDKVYMISLYGNVTIALIRIHIFSNKKTIRRSNS